MYIINNQYKKNKLKNKNNQTNKENQLVVFNYSLIYARFTKN